MLAKNSDLSKSIEFPKMLMSKTISKLCENENSVKISHLPECVKIKGSKIKSSLETQFVKHSS